MVIVSRSRKLAQGVKELAVQTAGEGLRIITAGGMTNGEIGIDSIEILEDILTADSGDGVVVLADLASSVKSALAAFDLLDDEKRKTVVIADAPIVEGAVGAAVQAVLGSPLDEVVAAAEEALGLQKLVN